MRVITQDNLWFTGPPRFENYVLRGLPMMSLEPLLGMTASDDLAAKAQELQWLLRYTGRTGRGLVIAQQWSQPGRRIDRNLPAWVEMFERHGRRARWLIFYDPVLAGRGRLGLETPIDFSSPEMMALFRSDLDHLAPWFDGPRYWRQDRRPVLYIWSVHSGVRNAGPAFAEARSRGLYVLGDVFGTERELENLDAATGFVSVIPPLGGRDHRVTDVLPNLRDAYETWSARLPTIPAASMQYDDTEFQIAMGDEGRSPTRVLARSRGDLRQLLSLLRAYAAQDLVFLGTANVWAEGTSILPTVRRGPLFGAGGRIGQYGFTHLELLREELFPRVTAYDGPRFRTARLGPDQVRVQLVDADVLASVRVTPKASLVDDRMMRGFRRVLAVRRGARVRVRNLDGKVNELQL